MKYYFLITLFLLFNFSNAQNDMAFKTGEWFKYKLSYSGWFKAGEATVNLNEDVNNDQLLHAKMIGKSTGALNLFFKVYDRYESYFYKKNIKPYRFKRNINEGGYTKNIEILFDQSTKIAKVNNFKKNTSNDFLFKENSQDMVSVFYYLRNFFNKDDLDENDEISIYMFFDSENYKLKIKYLSTEIINTNFGKILCHKIQPYVQSGRLFKKNESLKMWISADNNKIPIRIKAELIFGSVRADLDNFSNLNHPFEIKFD
tara:strand:- start:1159 stop:1932 length:774 start_codon:yes stop_codon:yes gene_type:complete